MSIAMDSEGLTISQAAAALGVSTRTVRRYIKAGKIPARLVPGTFGDEYRILQLPPDLYTFPPEDAPGDTSGQNPGQVMDIMRELHEKNLALAAQLGAATERIRTLESQVKLLAAASRPWWKRMFRKA